MSIRMPLVSTLAARRLSSRFRRIVIPNLSESFAPSRQICTLWSPGWSPVVSIWWPWSRPAFSGYRIYELLERHGIVPYLVNARHIKTVPGRKSDWNDAQWLQKLLALGLLRGSFRPDAEIMTLRTLAR
jgi:hypothetical protein